MRPVLTGITVATLLAPAALAAGFRSSTPVPGLPSAQATSAANGAALQLAISGSQIEVGGNDVARARRSSGPGVAVTQLLDAHGGLLATLVRSRGQGETTVRGAGATPLAVETGIEADPRSVDLDPEAYGLVWHGDDDVVAAIALNAGSALDFGGSVSSPPQESGSAPGPAAKLEFALLPNHPNPFRDLTSIHFVVPRAGHVQIQLFDVAGRTVARIVDDERHAGPGSVEYRPRGLAAGLYEMRMSFVASDGSPVRRAVRPILLLP